MTRSTRALAHITTAAASSLIRARNGLNVALAAVRAATFAWGTWADSGISATFADGSLGTFDFVHIHVLSLRTRAASTMTRLTRTLAHITAAAASSLIRARNGLNVTLTAVLAAAFAWGTWADSGVSATFADGSFGAFDFVHVHTGATSLLLLQISETASFGMDVLDLAGRLSVEVDELLTSWSTSSLLVVRVKAGPDAGCDVAGFFGDLVALVYGFGLVGCVVLAIEVLESLEESVGNAVLAI